VIRLLLALLLLPLVVAAETLATDGVVSEGLLTDPDFFRLVSCGAAPDGPCRGPILRWAKRDLTMALVMGEDAVPDDFPDRLRGAIKPALREINAAGSGIAIRLTDGPRADIRVMPTALTEGTAMADVPGFSGPGIMGVGYMTVWSDGSDQITSAVILISTAITEEDLPSVMLEEITQALGPLYDIENPAYEGVSILSQTSNETLTIAGQDAALLRWLYPPQN
jgi:Protein of unknown function (DUF2927)